MTIWPPAKAGQTKEAGRPKRVAEKEELGVALVSRKGRCQPPLDKGEGGMEGGRPVPPPFTRSPPCPLPRISTTAPSLHSFVSLLVGSVA